MSEIQPDLHSAMLEIERLEARVKELEDAIEFFDLGNINRKQLVNVLYRKEQDDE